MENIIEDHILDKYEYSQTTRLEFIDIDVIIIQIFTHNLI